ncbi:DUF262 domain-containing protein [Arenimonas metalli]|uniref:DUF262 domain-containing protein n=1 Tax=Arenimonas metalli TaxID=948077 RepID=UPI000A03DABC|nr:DUF262 domain-containing protein [Arenimonas metalli]
MIKIQPQYLSLSKLLDRRLFRIPDYQRAYSWTSQQRDDLFDDLIKTHVKGKDEGHFMAALVCLRRGTQELGTDEFQVLDVVDGQQRITTLILLLKTICVALDSKDKTQKKLQGELSDLLVKPDSDELLLLQTNHDSSHYFSDYLRKGKIAPVSNANTTADREILLAIEDCRRFVSRWRDNVSDLIALGALLKNRLYFLLHEIEEEKTVYTVFEVLNSRGLSVSWLDRLKSILMGVAFELPKVDTDSLIKELHTKWRDIYAVIGLRQGLSTEALRFAATLRARTAPSRTMSEEDAVHALRDLALNSAKGLREVASWLLEVTKASDRVVANHRLNAVTRISQARLLAVAISLRDDISKADKEKLLAQWERVTFRIYGMMGNDARTRVGDYIRLAWQVVNENLSKAEIGRGIAAIGKDFPIEKAVDELRNANCYEGWEVELRYFMFRYEEHLSRNKGMIFSKDQWEKIWMASPSDSIEHIHAKSKAPEKQKHRLGNLVLLTPNLNSKLSAKPAKEKADSYIKTGLLVAGRVGAMISKSGAWSKKEIEAWEGELVAWAEKEWAD